MIEIAINQRYRDRDQLYVVFFALMASITLIIPILPLPGPGAITGLPWKVESLSSLSTSVFLVAAFVYRKKYLLESFDLSAYRQCASVILFLAAFILWSGLSVAWSAFTNPSLQHTATWTLYLVICLFAARYHQSRKYIIAAAVLTSIVVAASCISDYLSMVDFSSAEGTLRIRYAKYAELLVTISPLLWGVAMSIRRKLNSGLVLLAGAAGWVTVMLSLSRGAFLAGLAAFAVTFVGTLMFSRHYRRRAFLFGAIWVVITATFQIFPALVSTVPSTATYMTSQPSDPTKSTSQMRMFTWKVTREMIQDNWLIGVGANNFGSLFNESRRKFAAANPNDPDQRLAEDYLVERAHNEPLQIFAELGIVGIALFAAAFGIFAFWVFQTLIKKRNLSPIFIASLGGMVGFAISSLFSSFSFRAAQNGIAFAMVFGLALRYLINLNSTSNEKARDNSLTKTRPKLLFAASLMGTVFLLIISTAAGLSRIYQYRADAKGDLDEKAANLQQSIYWDQHNAGAISTYASVIAAKGDYGRAADLLHQAVDDGVGVTQIYSSLANMEIMAGQSDRAETTMSEAVAIFPGSVFARARYAQMLELNGRNSMASDQLAAARSIDLRQSLGWTLLLHKGDLATFLASQDNPNVSPPAELTPADAVVQFVDRGIFKGR